MKVRVGIFVHGRFHAFNFAQALKRAGADVTIFTNYPPWVVRRFGVDGQASIHTFWLHGLVSRVLGKIERYTRGEWTEPFTHRMFGRWAARQLKNSDFDVVHLWSGIAEESLLFLRRTKPRQFTVVVRGSAHIRGQRELLLEEQNRAGVPLEVPSLWRVAREEREYELASAICTISSFAFDTFRDAGFPQERLILAPLGVEARAFRASPEETRARAERILSGSPLRVLTVGALSFRKGALDYQRVVRKAGNLFDFRFVGATAGECRSLAADLRDAVEFVGRVPQSELRSHYGWADVFFFPTIEDGFAAVLAQAHAANLPIVTTANSSGPDLIERGKTGWITPVRDSEEMWARLLWCHQNRNEVVDMCRAIAAQDDLRSWDNMASDYLAAISRHLNSRRTQPRPADQPEPTAFHA